jgi:tRNA-2-methylthio-N6-dimethylallyladenosine synthase
MKREGGVKAWVSIMYGCDNFCAYCIVPYTRGRERSRVPEQIISEINNIAGEGFKEITLLGQNVNSYGKGLQNSIDFPVLLKKIHDLSNIERIRFVTSHPKDLSEELIDVMRDLPRVCEHMHLPLQAGSDKVLSLMNRSYTYSDYKEKVERLRKAIPGIAITSDIITGFPGETDEDFKLTLKALEEIRFDGIYSFKYSKRPGTKALELPDHIDESVKSERLTEMLELQEVVSAQKNKELEGSILQILVEGRSGSDTDRLTGRAMTNKIVNYPGDNEDVGKLINIKILEGKQHSLNGEKV